MDAIYQRTHLGDSLLHTLQQLCLDGDLDGGEARKIINDFNEIMAEELRSPANSGPQAAILKGKVTRYNFAHMTRNKANMAWTGQGGPTWFICLSDASLKMRGKDHPLKGIVQLGVRRRVGASPSSAVSAAAKSDASARTKAVGNSMDPSGAGQGEDAAENRTRQNGRKGRKRLRVPSDGKADSGRVRTKKRGAMVDRRIGHNSAGGELCAGGDSSDDDLDDLAKELEGMSDSSDNASEMSGLSATPLDSDGDDSDEDDRRSASSDQSLRAAAQDIAKFLQDVQGTAADDGASLSPHQQQLRDTSTEHGSDDQGRDGETCGSVGQYPPVPNKLKKPSNSSNERHQTRKCTGSARTNPAIFEDLSAVSDRSTPESIRRATRGREGEGEASSSEGEGQSDLEQELCDLLSDSGEESDKSSVRDSVEADSGLKYSHDVSRNEAGEEDSGDSSSSDGDAGDDGEEIKGIEDFLAQMA